MKKATILLFLIPFIGFAQNNECDCNSELNFIAAKLKSVPSFRSQVKKERIIENQRYLESISKEITADTNIDLNCVGYLQKYLKIVKDQHLYIIKNVKPVKGDFEAFYNRPFYKLTPIIKQDRESLLQKAANDNDAITTIYTNVSKSYKVIIIKDETAIDTYLGVLIYSNNEYWKPGQVRFILKKTEENKFDSFEYDGYHRPKYEVSYFKNGIVYPNHWIPESRWNDYKVNPYSIKGKEFRFKSLNETTNYLYLGSFSGSNTIKKKADSIYAVAENEIAKKSHLILDVRNNTGGGVRTYGPFLKLLSSYKNLTIYLIQNKNCGSACEQFILKLKNKKRLTILGEHTKGTLAYGYGNGTEEFITPCYGFKFQPTSKKYEKYLKYETIGIPPDVFLDFKTDWIDQSLNYIKNN